MIGDTDEPRLPIDLGDEVLYQGMRWRVDDEVLVGLEGQPDLLWGAFDPDELDRVPEAEQAPPPADGAQCLSRPLSVPPDGGRLDGCKSLTRA
jgi:hypothetical protein